MSRVVSIFDSKILHILERKFVLFSLFVAYSYSLTFVFLLNYDKKVQLQVLKTNMFVLFIYLQYIHVM